jgi:hypothetical protein
MLLSPDMSLTCGEWGRYRWRVTLGQLIGVAAQGYVPAAPSDVSPATTVVRLIPVSSAAAVRAPEEEERECSGEEGCEHRCFAGGGATVSASSALVGALLDAEADAGCECRTLSGLVEGETMTSGAWRFEAHRPSGLVLYRYAASSTSACWGLLNVSGGLFLGIPRPPEQATAPPPSLLQSQSPTTLSGPAPVSVAQAEATARAMTVIVSTALGISMATAVSTAVGSAMGTAASGATSSGGGGAAVTLIQQVRCRLPCPADGD